MEVLLPQSKLCMNLSKAIFCEAYLNRGKLHTCDTAEIGVCFLGVAN